MKFSLHGVYTIDTKANYFVIKYMGSWNEEAARSMFEEFKAIVDASGFETFGIISDLQEWEGSTPEALAVAVEGLNYLYEKGQIASAQVSDSFLSQKLAEPIYALQKSRMHSILLTTVEDAMSWMEETLP